MNPFDIKSVLLAKHAQHAVLVHFPIALFLAGVAFDWLALWKRSAALAAAVRPAGGCCLDLARDCHGNPGLALADGARLKGNLLFHLVLGTISTLVIGWSGGFTAGPAGAHTRPCRFTACRWNYSAS